MEDLKQLQQKLKEMEGKDISVHFEGSLRLILNVKKMQSIVTNTILLISNSELVKNEEVEIVVDDIVDIKIKDDIILKMNGNYQIDISS